MMKLLTMQLELPGEWRDVWLYKNRMFVWDRDGRMFFLDLETAAKHLATNYGAGVATLAQMLIFRNDWKVSEQLRTMLRVPEVEAAYIRPLSKVSHIVATLPPTLFRPSESDQYRGAVFDTCIYADRLYLATPDGLLESYINSKHPDRAYPLDRQMDLRVSRLAIRYAAINASAEEEGLFFARVNFGTTDDAVPGFRRAKFSRIAEYSTSASHAARNLLNYTRDSVPILFRAKVEEARTHTNARYDEHQVVGYDSPADLLGLTYSALRTITGADQADSISSSSEDTRYIEVLGNSSYHLLVAWHGRLRVVDINAFAGQDIEARPSIGYRKTELTPLDTQAVLETYPISGGFVVELFDSLRLITRDGSFPLMEGQVARLRTFTSSIRYKEAIGVVQERSTSLLGYYVADEAPF